MKAIAVRLEVIVLGFWIFFIFGLAQAAATDWKLYHASEEEFYFYDSQSITKRKGVVKVSEKSVVREIKPCNLTEALKKVVEIEKKSPGEMSAESHKKAVDGLALQVTRRLYEMRCSKKTYRIITGMEYDKEGTLLDGIISSKWDSVPPNSIIEELYKAVCD